MSYASRFRGTLTVSGNGKSYPDMLVKLAAENGVPLPSTTGLSEASITALRQDSEVAHFLEVSAQKIKTSHNEGGMYNPKAILDTLIQAASNDDCLLNGYLVRLGEEQGDLEKFSVEDNVLTVSTASLVWSDGIPVDIKDYQL